MGFGALCLRWVPSLRRPGRSIRSCAGGRRSSGGCRGGYGYVVSCVRRAVGRDLAGGVLHLEPRAPSPQPAPAVAQELHAGRRDPGGRFAREYSVPPDPSPARNPGHHPRPFVRLQPRPPRLWTASPTIPRRRFPSRFPPRPPGPQTGAVACFHYRTLLAIPDIGRSPFPISGGPRTRAPNRCSSSPCSPRAR